MINNIIYSYKNNFLNFIKITKNYSRRSYKVKFKGMLKLNLKYIYFLMFKYIKFFKQCHRSFNYNKVFLLKMRNLRFVFLKKRLYSIKDFINVDLFFFYFKKQFIMYLKKNINLLKRITLYLRRYIFYNLKLLNLNLNMAFLKTLLEYSLFSLFNSVKLHNNTNFLFYVFYRGKMFLLKIFKFLDFFYNDIYCRYENFYGSYIDFCEVFLYFKNVSKLFSFRYNFLLESFFNMANCLSYDKKSYFYLNPLLLNYVVDV